MLIYKNSFSGTPFNLTSFYFEIRCAFEIPFPTTLPPLNARFVSAIKAKGVSGLILQQSGIFATTFSHHKLDTCN